jgi:hypothetical protein
MTRWVAREGYIGYLLPLLLSFLLIFWCVPETKGKATADEVWHREERRID